MAREDLSCLNDGSPTRINRATGGMSAPDVTLVHSDQAGRCEWSCLPPLDSDHFPILCELDLVVQKMQDGQARFRWDWTSGDWAGYRSSVEATIRRSSLWDSSRLEDMVAEISDAMFQAARDHIKMVRIAPRPIPWMTPELARAIQHRNHLGRDLVANRQEWVEACRQVRNLSSEIRSRRWKVFIESLESHTDCPRAWNTLRSLSGKAPAQMDRCKTILHGGKEFVTDRSKAGLFVRKYAQISRHRFTKEERVKNRRVRMRMTRSQRMAGPWGKECGDFSLSELATAIREMRSKGAEGPDGIPPRFLKELGPEARRFILCCFNLSWKQGRLPQSWRNAEIIPLLKRDKPAGDVDSYRPISLTSCMGKLMERLVTNRLYHLAESRGLLVEDQAGFRGQRSTEDQILRITQSIDDGFQAVPALRSALALLDFSKAYDTVWRLDLLNALMEAGIPFPYIRWIRGFLTNRQGRVRLNSAVSDFKLFREGVPQGSVLSPLLFLFVINDLRPRIKSSITSMFADDVGLLAQSRFLPEAARQIESDVVEVHRWSMEKKLHLNIAKCEVSFFSPDPGESTPQSLPPIIVDSRPLKFNPTPRFLGVTYDRTLSFRPQAELVAGKLAGVRRLLSALAGKDWGWDTQSLRRVYQSLGLSAARYCSPGWAPWLARSNLEVLERAQNRCLRAITGLHATAPVDALRREGGFCSIGTAFRKDSAVAMEKSLRLPQTNPRSQIATKQVRHRTKRPATCWRKLAGDLVRDSGLQDQPRSTLPPPTSAPWQWGVGNWNVNLDLIGGASRAHSEKARLVDALATICSYGPLDLTIFTDGSVEMTEGSSGSAAVVCQGTPANLVVVECLARRGAKLASSFDAELSALRVAVEWLVRRGLPGHFLICSDSRSVLSALQSGSGGQTSDLYELRNRLREVPGVLGLQWVPGHCGLGGNELADKAANAARRLEGPPTPISFGTARAYLRRTIRDPPSDHHRTNLVYGDRPPPPGRPPGGSPSSKKVAIAMAQLRSGHSYLLAAYRHMIGASPSPLCPRCEEDEETLEHWFQRCPATLAKRVVCFGVVSPPLSLLRTDETAVASYLRSLRLL
jgi:ribonuclease HI